MYRLSPIRNRGSSQNANFRYNLGIDSLIPEWKKIFSKTHLKDDLIAGMTVVCIAIPLSLAIALASGVDPVVGLTTGIVASIVCSLFGGTPLSVSGPAAAMAVLIAEVVQNFGMGGLLLVGFICGLLQVLTGVFRLGQFIRFVPLPVIVGFTTGIGVIILIGQIPRALGIHLPEKADTLFMITHILDFFHEYNATSVALALSTLGIVFVMPKVFPKIPATLVAVVLPTLVALGMNLDVDTIGHIPQALKMPHLPELPQSNWGSMLWAGVIVFVLASMETLLSSSAVDKMSKSKRHDPDQEMIGQGLGNLASSLFGGIPATGVIARSSLNVHAGAKTRRASLIHGILLIGAVYIFSPLLGKIPLAILAGVMLSVSLRMLHPGEFMQLWKASNDDVIIYVITLLATVFVDLIVGVQAGVIGALIIAALRIGKTRARIYNMVGNDTAIISLDGNLNFLSSSKLESIREQVSSGKAPKELVLDLSRVETIDASGANLLTELLEHFKSQNKKFAVKGLSEKNRQLVLANENAHSMEAHFALSEVDVLTILGRKTENSGLDKLVYGVERFRREVRSSYDSIFKKLEYKQAPHTLFITCSDSRINPNLITTSEPGELFVIRNVGNIVPKCGDNSAAAEGAAIEFALSVLGVHEIVVCGHSECGAIRYMMNEDILSEEQKARTPTLAHWMGQVADLKKELSPQASLRHAIERNALSQVENLKTYPIVREKLLSGELRIHSWYYDIGMSELEQWDERKKLFVTVGANGEAETEKNSLQPHAFAPV